MAKGMYAVIDGNTKKITKEYAVVDGKTHEIKKKYAVIEGKTKLVWELSDSDVPDIPPEPVTPAVKRYIVVAEGKSSIYDKGIYISDNLRTWEKKFALEDDDSELSEIADLFTINNRHFLTIVNSYGTKLFYSDDEGETWARGNTIITLSSEEEYSVLNIKLIGDVLIGFCKNDDITLGKYNNLLALSYDGVTWKPVYLYNTFYDGARTFDYIAHTADVHNGIDLLTVTYNTDKICAYKVSDIKDHAEGKLSYFDLIEKKYVQESTLDYPFYTEDNGKFFQNSKFGLIKEYYMGVSSEKYTMQGISGIKIEENTTDGKLYYYNCGEPITSTSTYPNDMISSNINYLVYKQSGVLKPDMRIVFKRFDPSPENKWTAIIEYVYIDLSVGNFNWNSVNNMKKITSEELIPLYNATYSENQKCIINDLGRIAVYSNKVCIEYKETGAIEIIEIPKDDNFYLFHGNIFEIERKENS